MGITWPFFIRFLHYFKNCLFFETNQMVQKAKLYLLQFRIQVLDPIFHQGQCWAQGSKTTHKLQVCVQAISPNSYLIIDAPKICLMVESSIMGKIVENTDQILYSSLTRSFERYRCQLYSYRVVYYSHFITCCRVLVIVH